MTTDRRAVLKGAGIGALLFSMGGGSVWLTACEARKQGVPFGVLSKAEAAALEAFGDVLLPGAAEAGIAHFVDSQLAADPADSLLMLRYLDVPPPHDGFYKGGLAALEAVAKARFGVPFGAVGGEARENLVRELSAQSPDDWTGPPAPFFYFVVRADAVDVVYGTVEGFESLGIPYMPHIEPERRW